MREEYVLYGRAQNAMLTDNMTGGDRICIEADVTNEIRPAIAFHTTLRASLFFSVVIGSNDLCWV